jgi:hypothetical protein
MNISTRRSFFGQFAAVFFPLVVPASAIQSILRYRTPRVVMAHRTAEEVFQFQVVLEEGRNEVARQFQWVIHPRIYAERERFVAQCQVAGVSRDSPELGIFSSEWDKDITPVTVRTDALLKDREWVANVRGENA